MKLVIHTKIRKRRIDKRNKKIWLFNILELTQKKFNSQKFPVIKSKKTRKTVFRKGTVYYKGNLLTKNKLKKIEEEQKILKVIEKEDVQLRLKGKNDYKNLWKELKSSTKGKDIWIMELKEEELYKILGSKGRKHISSKYGLSFQITKDLTELAKREKGKDKNIYCNFTSSEMVYYISNRPLK